MIALFGNLSLLEIVLIGALAVMIFGRDLPRTAAKLYTHFTRARTAMRNVWRESGLGEEFRQVQREMEQTAATLRQQSPEVLAKDVVKDVEARVREPLPDQAATDPPEEVASERGAEDQPKNPRPPWYPDSNEDPFSGPSSVEKED